MWPEEGERIRWEAWSHERMYREVHELPAAGRPLAATIPMWARVIGDLQEVRSSYTVAVDHLLAHTRGAAEGLRADQKKITGLLTDAVNRADTAKRQHIVFQSLNQRLRVELPEPDPARSQSWRSLAYAGWMLPPDFDKNAKSTRDLAELARDQMRRYERETQFERLAQDSPPDRDYHNRQATQPDLARSRTIPVHPTITQPTLVRPTAPQPADALTPTLPMPRLMPPLTPTPQPLDFGPMGAEAVFGYDGDAESTQRLRIGPMPSAPLPPAPPPPRRPGGGVFDSDEPTPPPVIGE